VPSPFVYEEPVDPDQLVDRQKELADLLDRTLAARNARLEGPRRFGKTSLVRAVLAAAEKEGVIPIEVNFLGCVSAADVSERIERAYRARLEGPLRRWFDGLVRTLQPSVKVAPAGVGVSAQLQATQRGLIERLALPARIQERSGRQCVIAFDEFQEVVRVAPALPGVFRSVLEEKRHAAGYIFSGSHPGLMRELFSDRRHAFFAQARPVQLGPLPPDALADFISARFAATNRDPGEGLGPLLDAAEGHPQRAMLLAHHLYEGVQPRKSATIEQWLSADEAAKRETLGEIEVLWDSCSSLERRVLKAVAHRTVPLSGKEAADRFGLGKSGSTQVAVDRLFAEGHLVRDDSARSGWRVLDPFLADWLREEYAR
jgi:uncharacterized protein